MIVFDGNSLAEQRELELKSRLASSDFCDRPVIAAILFVEDAGSRLYTALKAEAATRVGIEYRVFEFSLKDDIQKVQAKIAQLGQDPEVTGIIIQKPWRKTWVEAQDQDFFEVLATKEDPTRFKRDQYASWWTKLTSYIDETKDVDGLHPITIKQIAQETWQLKDKVLPATCQAVLTILQYAKQELSSSYSREEIQSFFDSGKYLIIGKSDLMGIPLFYELRRQEKSVEILASKDLKERIQSGKKLLDATVVVTATGRKGLVTGEMVSDNVVVIDVGEPMGDVEFSSVAQKASFITPVPGGVGPMTVVSLLENCFRLCELKAK